MTISVNLEKVAHLARLDLSADELEKYRGGIETILGYVQKLETVDVRFTVPMASAVETTNVMRDDEPRSSLSQGAALANAPEAEDGFFTVPKIIEA